MFHYKEMATCQGATRHREKKMGQSRLCKQHIWNISAPRVRVCVATAARLEHLTSPGLSRRVVGHSIPQSYVFMCCFYGVFAPLPPTITGDRGNQ